MADAINNVTKLLTALVGPFQSIENTLQQMLTERSVDTAVGAQLDILGKIVGQVRGDLDDDDYRRYVRARITANRSQGTTEDLIAVASLVINDLAALIQVDNIGHAGYLLEWKNTVPPAGVADILIAFLIEAQAAGVRGILESLTVPEEDTFRCAVAAFPAGALTAGNTSIAVPSTADFPAAGSLDIDFGLSVHEVVTYSGKDPTHFLGVSALAHSHSAGCCVQLHETGRGFPTMAIASAINPGDTSIIVDTTSGFPSSGTIVVDPGLGSAETIAYTSTNATHFLGVTAAASHSNGAYVYPPSGPGGGSLRDARDRVLGF